ncbi:MAG: hypothetical protein GEV10_19865 [Streptosporangiales bacterium]|nr:hypothetical protein [Streptosporangiales bacterium]
MTRHLIGAGFGVVAVPVLLVLSWWSAREYQLTVQFFRPGHGALFLLSVALVGVVAGVLCAGRFVSPVASVVAGGVLLVINLMVWAPLALRIGGRLELNGFLFRAVGLVPTLLALSFVLLTASAFPSRWVGERSRPAPRPLPAQEVQRP